MYVFLYTGLFEMIVGVLTACHTQYTWDSSICIFLFNRTTLQVFVTYLTGALYRVIRNDCQDFNNLSYTIYLRQEYMCFFYLIEQHSQVFVTYVTGALYVHPLWFYKHQHDNRVRSKLSVACQWWWFQWRFWFVPSVLRYLWEEEEHKPPDSSMQLHTPISSVLCMTSC